MVKPVRWVKGPLALNKGGPTRFVAMNDVHVPHNIPLRGVFDFIAYYKPDYIILNGDIINNEAVSHWDRAVPRKMKELPNIKPGFDQANRLFFNPLRDAAGPAQIVYPLGNHELWSQNYVDNYPELEGLVEPWHHLVGIDGWAKRGDFVSLGRLNFIHGDVIQGNPQNVAKAMVTRYRRDIRFGHFHQVEEASYKGSGDMSDYYTARCCGTLQKIKPLPSFMKSGLHDWINAFTIGEVFPDGSFQDQIIRVSGTGKFKLHGRSWG